jgi:hypothetical protein
MNKLCGFQSFEKKNNAPEHVIPHLGKKGLFDKVGVMCFQKLLGSLLGLHGSQLVSLGLESTNNVTNNSTLKTRTDPELEFSYGSSTGQSFRKEKVTYLHTIGLDLKREHIEKSSMRDGL